MPSTRSTHRIVIVALAATLLLLPGCGGSGGSSGTGAPAAGDEVPPSERVAVQASDLPAGMIRCPQSGEMTAHIEAVRERNAGTAASLEARWRKYQIAGATAAYVSYVAADEETCYRPYLPPEQRMPATAAEMGHRQLVFTFVIQFRDEAAAAVGYDADLFSQSKLKDRFAFNVTEGIPTGLGPKSIFSASQGALNQTLEAVWQSKAFNVFLGSTAVDLPAAQTALREVNSRIG